MNHQPRQFLIEGVDRLGKSTLIKNISDVLGYHLNIHYDKPKKLTAYEGFDNPLLEYQKAVYSNMFNLIDKGHRIVFDRAHLGETIYAPIYRKYSGDYVFDLEARADTSNARLILLTTSDFSFVQDDGNSLDFTKREEEQARFVEAFHRSKIHDKVLIDVNGGNHTYKRAQDVLAEALKKTSLLASRTRL